MLVTLGGQRVKMYFNCIYLSPLEHWYMVAGTRNFSFITGFFPRLTQ